jgi:phage baseplate assembly protein W
MSLLIDNLKVVNEKEIPLYVDIRFDLEEITSNKSSTFYSKSVNKDIAVDINLEAVKNSLYNLFTTIPGQKILNPIYGLNLMQFVFNGITEGNSKLMGEIILRGINIFEPRVVVQKIYIFPDIENHTYQIGLRLDVPSLDIKGLTLKGSLSESGFFID